MKLTHIINSPGLPAFEPGQQVVLDGMADDV
jgi:hypothetical protein